MRGQAKLLTIAIRYTEEKLEHTRQSQDKQTTHRSSGPRRNCGGGLPEFSFNIIAGAPGSGKTTLAHANAFAELDFEVPSQRFEWRADSNWWPRPLGLTQRCFTRDNLSPARCYLDLFEGLGKNDILAASVKTKRAAPVRAWSRSSGSPLRFYELNRLNRSGESKAPGPHPVSADAALGAL
jgi:hypothetical protein